MRALTLERYDALAHALDSFEDAHADATHYRDDFASWPVVYPGVAYNLRFRGVQESMWYATRSAQTRAVATRTGTSATSRRKIQAG